MLSTRESKTDNRPIRLARPFFVLVLEMVCGGTSHPYIVSMRLQAGTKKLSNTWRLGELASEHEGSLVRALTEQRTNKQANKL